MKLYMKPSENKFFDFKIGLAGGLVMGIIIFLINYLETGLFMGSFTAALKQAFYTFLFGGSIMKLCETIAVKINQKWTAIFLAMLIPSAISLGLTFGLHSLKGTPLPLESTIPTAIFVIPSTFIWGYLKRKKIPVPDRD